MADRGKSVKVEGIKTCRTHHLASSWEERLFYYLEFDPTVVDLREQFPLFPVDVVERVANAAGLKYPHHGNHGDHLVLSTDMVATTLQDETVEYFAYAVKQWSELSSQKVRERLEIERLWWSSLGVKWFLVTDRQLDRVTARNLKWCSDVIRGGKRAAIDLEEKLEVFDRIETLEPGERRWNELVSEVSNLCDLSEESTSKYLRLAIWEQRLKVDLREDIKKKNQVKVLSANRASREVTKIA